MAISPADSDWASGLDLSPTLEAVHCYPFTVVSRLACSLYGLDHSAMYMRLKTVVQGFRFEEWDAQGTIGAELIRGFIIHAVEKVRAKGIDVNAVVVLADEVYAVQQSFRTWFKGSMSQDLTSILGSAMLSDKVLDDLDAGLVLSSLVPSPIGETSSGRTVEAVKLPPLDPEEIVDCWWERPADKDKLIATAAALSDLPRAVEFAHDYIVEHIPKGEVSMESVAELMKHVMGRLKARYEPEMISPKQFRAVVFQERIALDLDTIKSVMDSTFTNSISRFKEHSTIVPSASLVLLSAGAQDSGDDDYAAILRELPDRLFVEKLKTVDDGEVLEWALAWWLRLRLELMANEKITVGKLFQLRPKLQGQWHSFAGVTFDVKSVSVIPDDGWPLSHAEPEAFMRKLNTIKLCEGDVVLLHPHPREVFDLLLAVRDVDGRIRITLIDAKSAVGKNQVRGTAAKPARMRRIVKENRVRTLTRQEAVADTSGSWKRVQRFE